MPSAIHVVICAIAALALWVVIGFVLSRRLLPASLAVPAAPVLGWAFHNALALPLFRLIGFTPWTATLGAVAILAIAWLLSRSITPNDERDTATSVPLWAYGLAAALAAVPALALFPKFSGDTVALAGPIFDHSKVAIIDEMTRLGVPPGNPFFGEAGHETHLAYYYLWHFSAAQLALIFHVSGWEADIALSAFTAFASVALMMGFATWIGGSAAAGIWVLPLALAASLHPVLEILFGADTYYSTFLPPTGFAGWLFQTTWAPQHIASTSCVVLSGFLLVLLARQPRLPTLIVLALVTAAGYESSTWDGGILFGAGAPILAIILLLYAPANMRIRFVGFAMAAALATAALAYPFLHDQYINAAARGVGSPIAFYPYPVFNVEVSEPLRWLTDIPGFWLALLVIEFPAIYVPGAISLTESLRVKTTPGSITMTTKVFTALTVVSLLIAGFFTITFADNNDLGWRAVLPGVFILTIFAATGLSRWLTRPLSYTAAGALLLLLLGMPRSFQLVADNMRGTPSESGIAFAASTALWDAVRRHSGPAERVANNPQYLADMTPWPVNISWALFANRPSCFAGSDLALPYTSLPRARLEDIDDQFQRVFDGEGSTDDVRNLAMRYQCRVAVLTPRDGAWRHDPFAGSSYYTIAEEKPGAWKIYRATSAPKL